MKFTLTAVLAALAALVIANMIGTAVAEAPTTTTLRTVSVEGIGSQPIAQNADAATATGVYRQAMAAAVADGQAKAEFLTGRVGATLGAAQTITEDGGGIECNSGAGEEEGWEPYQGEQPDFGSARNAGQVLSSSTPTPAAASPSKGSSTPVVKRTSSKRHRKHRRPVAKKATAAGCKLTAQVSLAYIMG
jgi:hypothetical protein